MEAIDLNDEKIDALTGLIKDSFRVRPNQDPIYVDVSGNLGRIQAAQHQIIFGRRGSGKSCLLVHFHRAIAPKTSTLSVYLDSDELKRLGYPDALIRLLLRITEDVAQAAQGRISRLLRLRRSPLWEQARKLRSLLDLAEESDVTYQVQRDDTLGADGAIGTGSARAGVNTSTRRIEGTTSSFKARKLEALERSFPDFKRTLQEEFGRSRFKMGTVIVDDFYLFTRDIQPDVLDYLHRLLRGTDLYLKIGTVRHRTSLQRSNGQTIGVDPSEDVEEISLDRTFEHVDSTREFLELMLDSMAREVGLETAASFMSTDGRLALALASGGVPRDYLNTLVEAVPAARALAQQRVTPRTVYKGAGRLAYRNKLGNLRDDAGTDAKAIELVFADLARFCLKEERKTGFLISQEEVQTHPDEHEIIQQLMDFKLVHIIEPDTSAASGRRGRFEAYTLDFSLFMEPRLRGIKHIEFWKTDEQRRREGVREAPHYSLERAKVAAAGEAAEASETVLEELEREIGVDEVDAAADTLF
jgi:energy-coupling factor transporter ATP-binding protein EcfA2